MLKKNQFRLITNVLTAAIKLWLRTQVSHVEQLQVEILGGDRQIISGNIPTVSIVAQKAVYQGLHLSFINLVAKNICIDISSILKGKNLQLLEKISVFAELNQQEADLSASLSSTLLSTVLNDVLVKFLPEYSANSKSISWEKITIKDGLFVIFAVIDQENNPQPLDICMGLKLLSPHELSIAPICVTSNTKTLFESHEGEYIDLGFDIEIQELQIIPGKIICRGIINVNP
ncbi:MAG: DUF2993 domain-containing protein [Rivularia sp. T60_A2020_040]|nr:DUF2993 domain-containing protein [Rivularia sp. T60_A2020_040]